MNEICFRSYEKSSYQLSTNKTLGTNSFNIIQWERKILSPQFSPSFHTGRTLLLAQNLPHPAHRRHTPVFPCHFSGWGLSASLALREPHLWGLPLLSRSPCSLQELCQSAHERRCLATGHSWCLTPRPELLYSMASIRAKLPTTLPYHLSPLYLPEPLWCLLQHYLWASSYHPPPLFSLSLMMTASPRCQAASAVHTPHWPQWFGFPACSQPQRNRSSLH